MAKKIRMIMTQVIEYEPDVDNYCDAKTYEEMADIDEHTDDIVALFDTEDAKLNITWEIIERSEDGDYGLCNSKEHWKRTGRVTKIE
ncbi:hypothetical protein QB607_003152 [Clostridium botulinum]|nr:hypothetical protein [Clostridium botulinum]EKS4395825.1 hypothetical protein [Clostridium botulinum]